MLFFFILLSLFFGRFIDVRMCTVWVTYTNLLSQDMYIYWQICFDKRKEFEFMFIEAWLYLLRFECLLNMWIFWATKTQPMLLVWLVSSHSNESSKLILIHPYIYIYIYTHIFPSFGGTLISEWRGRVEKRVRYGLGSGGGFEVFFLRRWTQREGWRGVEGKKRWVWEPSLQMNIHVREVVSVSVRHWMKYCVQFYIAQRP